MKQLLFGTHNLHKLQEIRDMLGDTLTVISLREVGDIPEVEETADTLTGNARLKSRGYYAATGIPCFADDTGLEVEALDGRPGVYAARYAGPEATYADNVAKLLAELGDHPIRTAQFRTVIAYYDGHQDYFFEGVVPGEIIREPAGTGGFGYDPVFRPAGYEVTFAEMTPAQKHAISHRGRALAAFVSFIHNL
ncbi:MAG: RdgB/HAM1 family non-canonical purine NTP pyrophosphatase [Bacteroidia bacterium]|jgi:XTP/dITP diphosphohydrolase|nr:RdgB/HAM1 family non-canonical purine NTP pyrophosphatase [Bacteroidia bacterium]